MKFNYDDRVIITDGFYKGQEGNVFSFEDGKYTVFNDRTKLMRIEENEMKLFEIKPTIIIDDISKLEGSWEFLKHSVSDLFKKRNR